MFVYIFIELEIFVLLFYLFPVDKNFSYTCIYVMT